MTLQHQRDYSRFQSGPSRPMPPIGTGLPTERWPTARRGEKSFGIVRTMGRQSQNLTHWSVFRGRESPTYQPRAKSIPRAEKRPWPVLTGGPQKLVHEQGYGQEQAHPKQSSRHGAEDRHEHRDWLKPSLRCGHDHCVQPEEHGIGKEKNP
jgi:hypothetical protein